MRRPTRCRMSMITSIRACVRTSAMKSSCRVTSEHSEGLGEGGGGGRERKRW